MVFCPRGASDEELLQAAFDADAIAIATVLFMLALLRNIIIGDRTERESNQIQMKEQMMIEGITELSDCKVGLIGFGDITKETAKRLDPFECEIYYYTKVQKPVDVEKDYHVSYIDLSEMARTCAYIVNTARDEIIYNQALYDAIVSGKIQGAGLDTVVPEPTLRNHILLNLPKEYADRIIFSPHIGGITSSYFYRAHKKTGRTLMLH